MPPLPLLGPPPPAITIVWVPIVNDEASTVSGVLVEEHALMLAEVVPVTDTVAPTVKSGVKVLLARELMETKMGAVLPLGVNRKPLVEPLPS